MPRTQPTEPITVRATRKTVRELDALAARMDRSRNYLVNRALEQYLEANTWQTTRIREGLAAARKGHLRLAEDVFAEIAARHDFES